jgi:hypothetical protein
MHLLFRDTGVDIMGGGVSRSIRLARLYIYPSQYNKYGGRRLFISMPGIYVYQYTHNQALKVRKKVLVISNHFRDYFAGMP